MEIIQPLSKKGISPFIGHHVCAVLQDESALYGKLGGIKNGQLMLRSIVAETQPAASKNNKKNQRKVKASAAPGLGIPLTSVALLFTIDPQAPMM